MKLFRQIIHLSLINLFGLPALAQENTALPAASAHALAPLAPQDRWVARVELRSNSYDQRYNSNGKSESLGAAFDGVALDANVFPALLALGANASLGTTALSTEVTTKRVELTLGYGVTQDLTVGGIINFGSTQNQVGVSLAGGNVGWNPQFDANQAVGVNNFPFAPLTTGAVAAMTPADINQILANPAFGYEYAPLAGSKTSGPGEVIVGAMWRFHKSHHDNLVWGLGLRKSLADADDPDNLFDVPLDDGSDDLLTQLEYFRHWAAVDLRGLIKRTIQSSDEVIMRVPAPGEVLATAVSKEKLNRNLGNFWEYDLELGYRWSDWRTSATWHRWQKSADHYSSNLGSNTTALEANTNIDTNQWRLALSWSGINAWKEGNIPMPLVVKLELQETYEGHNMVDVRDIYLLTTTFF